MKKVYVCAPLGGNIEQNLKKVKTYTEYALRCGTAPVVPHFYAECLDDNNPKDREVGLAAGMSLLWLCDEVWVFGDTVTDGMSAELKFCKNLNIRVRKITEKEIQKATGGNTLYCMELPHRAVAVYIYLADRANKDGECWPAIPTIAAELKLSQSTVHRALRDLRKAGLLETEQRYRTKGGKSSLLYKIQRG